MYFCLGCGPKKEGVVHIRKVILFENKKQVGEAFLSLCDSCCESQEKKEKLLRGPIFGKFVDDFEIVT